MHGRKYLHQAHGVHYPESQYCVSTEIDQVTALYNPFIEDIFNSELHPQKRLIYRVVNERRGNRQNPVVDTNK